MKLIADYLENARKFEELAAAERTEAARVQLLDQASAYYKLAAKRAKALNIELPARPSSAQK